MSWGYKILFFYLGFVGLMVTMVFGAYQYKVNLVSKDYYERELIFQDVIDGSTNLTHSGEQLLWNHAGNELEIVLPEALSFGNIDDLEIWLFHPYDSELDFKINIDKTENNLFSIPFDMGRSLSMKLKVRWKHNGTPYYYENEIKP